MQLAGLETTKTRALQALYTAAKGDHGDVRRPGFAGLALKGNTFGYHKVTKTIGDMIKMRKEEQVANENKEECCGVEIDSTEDKVKTRGGLASSIQKAESAPPAKYP